MSRQRGRQDNYRMRHAVPLSEFQERLFDFVLCIEEQLQENRRKRREILAVNAKRVSRREPVVQPWQRVLYIDLQESKWEKGKEKVQQLWNPILENGRCILFWMIVQGIVVLQIMQVWSEGAIQEGMLICKWGSVVLGGSYLIHRTMKKGKATWNRLKRWVEEPMEEEVGKIIKNK